MRDLTDEEKTVVVQARLKFGSRCQQRWTELLLGHHNNSRGRRAVLTSMKDILRDGVPWLKP